MRRRGFTLVELIIGMVVTAMVMLALSVVTFAVANGWQSAEAADNATHRLHQFLNRHLN